jgi:hypothetical protein
VIAASVDPSATASVATIVPVSLPWRRTHRHACARSVVQPAIVGGRCGRWTRIRLRSSGPAEPVTWRQ